MSVKFRLGATRTNLAQRPNAQASGWTTLFVRAADDGSGLGGGAWTPDSGNAAYYIKAVGTDPIGVAFARIGDTNANRAVVEPSTTYLVSADLHMLQRGAGEFQAYFEFFDSGGNNLGSPFAKAITGLAQTRLTWRVPTNADTVAMRVSIGHNGGLDTGETVEFSVADIMVEREPNFVPTESGELEDEYEGKANGPLVRADSGQSWRLFEGGLGGNDRVLRLLNGTLTNTSTASGVSAGYAEAELAANVTRLTGKFRFGPTGSVSDGAYALVGSKEAAQLGDLNLNAHMVIFRDRWLFGVFVNGEFSQIDSAVFSTPLATDTDYYLQMQISGGLVFMQLPDGSTYVIRDSRISSEAGPYLYHEVYENNASTATKVAILGIWADSGAISQMELPGVGYFPTPAQITAGDAEWSGTAGASTSTFGPFVAAERFVKVNGELVAA